MPASEIDDIFASKGKGKAKSSPLASSSAVAASSPKAPEPSANVEKKKKKKDKKRKREDTDDDGQGTQVKQATDRDTGEKPPKRRVPETVLDPSVQPSAAPTKPPKPGRPSDANKAPKKQRDKEDVQRFKDSRGNGPSTSAVPHHHTLACNVVSIRAENGRGFCDIQRGRAWNHRPRRRQVSTIWSAAVSWD